MNDRNPDRSVFLENLPVTGLLDDLADRLLSIAPGTGAFEPESGAVYLYPHISVDGDAVGSVLALGLALEKAGVPFLFPLDEEIPPKLAFLPALERISMISPRASEAGLSGLPRQQIALAIDCSGADRLGARREWYLQAPEQLVLDHHVSGRPAEPGYVVDTTAAATGELVHELIGIMEDKTGRQLMDQTIARLLMTAIMSDTGSFVYSNTSSRTFAIAARLMRWKPAEASRFRRKGFAGRARPRTSDSEIVRPDRSRDDA